MHTDSLDKWRHEHVYLGHAHGEHERKLKLVIALTAAMTLIEVAAGLYFGSMALEADGWHMATHAGALSISAAAYMFARRRATDTRFTFGTGKVGDLAGFASAIILSLVALWLIVESVRRLAAPVPISFAESLLVAVVGLGVNLLSAWLLRHDNDHGRAHAPDGSTHQGHTDHNIRSAYLHVLADALTSVLAIAGLAAGLLLGWIWMDALVGIVGAVVIARWSYYLIRDTGAVLLDMTPDPRIAQQIRAIL